MKTNLPVNVASALCYIPFVGWIAAVVFLIIESEKTVRFNAVQSLVLALVLWLIPFVLGVTIILMVLSPVAWIVGIIVQVVLAVKTYNGEKVVLPKISDWSEKLLVKLTAATAKKA